MEDNEVQKTETKKSDYLLPASIVIAALLIGGAWVYSTGFRNTNPTSPDTTNNQTQSSGNQPNAETINLKAIDATDHIRGNPDAPVKIVEYSDLECPFCKQFHQTMLQVMQDYGSAGKVAWIYRHYPIDQLHPKARTSAQAAECANELGGNDKFWAFVDKYFQTTPSNNQIDLSVVPQIAVSIGLDKAKFTACLSSGKYNDKINASIQDAENAGAQGTPYSVVIAKDGRKFSIPGALPYSQVKSLIETTLQ